MKNKEFYTVRGYQLLEHETGYLTPAMEDYLEMIYRNSLSDGYIRTSRLAELLNVKDSSATKMVQSLGRSGLIEYKKYGIITLTEEGRRLGKYLLERHRIVESLLKLLGNSEDLLSQTELIEHCINKETLNNIDILVDFFNTNSEFKERFNLFKTGRS